MLKSPFSSPEKLTVKTTRGSWFLSFSTILATGEVGDPRSVPDPSLPLAGGQGFACLLWAPLPPQCLAQVSSIKQYFLNSFYRPVKSKGLRTGEKPAPGCKKSLLNPQTDRQMGLPSGPAHTAGLRSLCKEQSSRCPTGKNRPAVRPGSPQCNILHTFHLGQLSPKEAKYCSCMCLKSPDDSCVWTPKRITWDLHLPEREHSREEPQDPRWGAYSPAFWVGTVGNSTTYP